MLICRSVLFGGIFRYFVAVPILTNYSPTAIVCSCPYPPCRPVCLSVGLRCRLAQPRLWPARSCCQGVKRLTCSLYFSAHPEVCPSTAAGKTAVTVADIKTNPNWVDIRYDPQHHRFARDGIPKPNRNSSVAAGASKPGLWSGAKVQTGGVVAGWL